MKRYSEDEVCVKCGFDRIDDQFSHGVFFGYNGEIDKVIQSSPSIKRTCLRCKYSWSVAPLDAEQEGK